LVDPINSSRHKFCNFSHVEYCWNPAQLAVVNEEMLMKAVRQIDKIAYGVLLAGVINSVMTGLLRKNPGKSKSRCKSSGAQFYHGLIGAATAYKIFRDLGPKTKEEQRLIKLARLYNQAEVYQRRATAYRNVAERILRKNLKNLKEVQRRGIDPKSIVGR
jgi:hypothetical protein